MEKVAFEGIEEHKQRHLKSDQEGIPGIRDSNGESAESQKSRRCWVDGGDGARGTKIILAWTK